MVTKNIRPTLKLRTVLVLVFGAFLVLYGALGSNSWEMGRERQALEADVALLARGIRGDTPGTYSLQAELEAALVRESKAANLFPEQLTLSQALQGIISLSAQSNIGMTDIREKAPIRKIIGEHVYYASPFSLSANGSLESLLAFVTALEHGEEGPLVLNEVILSRGEEVYRISLDLAFYIRSRTETVPNSDAPSSEEGPDSEQE